MRNLSVDNPVRVAEDEEGVVTKAAQRAGSTNEHREAAHDSQSRDENGLVGTRRLNVLPHYPSLEAR
jgi:hypothetical protein